MRFVQDVVPQYDLTYSDVFMVPSLSAVSSRLDVDLTTPDGLGGKLTPTGVLTREGSVTTHRLRG